MPPNNNQQNPNGLPVQPQQPPAAAVPGQQYPQPVYPAATPASSYPAPAAPKEEGSPYDFFLESKQPKKKLLPGKGGLGFPKILIIAVVVFVMLGLVTLVLSAARKPSDSGTGLGSVITSQQEMIRVSGLAQKNLQSTSLNNFAATLITTLTTAQQSLILYSTQHGGKIDVKALAAAADSRNDRTLDSALAASTYDTAYHTIMQRLLSDYEVKLQQVNDTAKLRSEHDIAAKDLAEAKLLETMLGQQ